ncbi:hypothetical protein TNCV_1170091 [Trichonephila clavipes]|nr:hypothetical protein TNCV_1170091 [Trichonephila clavipes]
MDAVICFNEGAHARIKVSRELKINPVINTWEGLRKIDKAEMTVQNACKEAKTIERQNKIKRDALEEFMQDKYKSGMF